MSIPKITTSYLDISIIFPRFNQLRLSVANTGFEFGRFQGSDQVQGCKDYLIPDPTMVGGEENL